MCLLGYTACHPRLAFLRGYDDLDDLEAVIVLQYPIGQDSTPITVHSVLMLLHHC